MRLLLPRRAFLKDSAATLTVAALPPAGRFRARTAASSGTGQAPTITGVTTAATTATVTWSAPSTRAVTAYQVSRDGVDSNGTGAWTGQVGSGLRTKTFTRLVPGSTYNLGIAAVTASGVGTVATTRVVIAPASPRGVPGHWAVSVSGATLAAVSQPLSAPAVLEVDADLGDSALWLTPPATVPPTAARTAVGGHNLPAGRHLYGLVWTTTSMDVYMDGAGVASVPMDMETGSKQLAVVGTPVVVYRASVYVPA